MQWMIFTGIHKFEFGAAVGLLNRGGTRPFYIHVGDGSLDHGSVKHDDDVMMWSHELSAPKKEAGPAVP